MEYIASDAQISTDNTQHHDWFIEARHITKKFSKHTALDDVSMGIKQGRIFGLLGPNGAGKTTLIRILNRISIPDQGEVWMGGRLMEQKDILRIGYLPEERGLYKKMKVGEQAIFFGRLKGLSKAEAEKRLKYWFEKFDIMVWWNRKLEELSKGMAQKVQFIITILNDPDFLIFDEPFSGFDPVNVELIKKEILGLRDRGKTIIFSTHNMASVEEICDDFALINHSKVVLQGNVNTVKEQYRLGQYTLITTDQMPLGETDYYTVTKGRQKGNLQQYILQKKGNISNNELIALLAEKVEIRTFDEVLPTMNDIFLKTVGEESTWAQQQYENQL